MNYASPQNRSQLVATPDRLERSELTRLVLTRIEALKNQLDTFTVVDPRGEIVGEVRNFILRMQQLYLVVVQPDSYKIWRFVLLSSHLVQRVSLRDRTVYISTTHADVSYLPELHAKPRLNAGNHACIMAPVSQLPVPFRMERQIPLEAVSEAQQLLKRRALQTQANDLGQALVDAPEAPKVVAEAMDATHRLPNFKCEAHSAPQVTPDSIPSCNQAPKS